MRTGWLTVLGHTTRMGRVLPGGKPGTDSEFPSNCAGNSCQSPVCDVGYNLTGVLPWRQRGFRLRVRSSCQSPSVFLGIGSRARRSLSRRPVTGFFSDLRPIFPLLISKRWQAACGPTGKRKLQRKCVLALAGKGCVALIAVDTTVLVRLLTGDDP